jgi:hypothetical protein
MSVFGELANLLVRPEKDAGFEDTFASRFGAAPLDPFESAMLRQRGFANRQQAEGAPRAERTMGAIADLSRAIAQPATGLVDYSRARVAPEGPMTEGEAFRLNQTQDAPGKAVLEAAKMSLPVRNPLGAVSQAEIRGGTLYAGAERRGIPNWLPVTPRPSIEQPLRVANPGIYKDPRDIAREAELMVAPEHPALKKLFGVTRDDLYEIGGRGTRKGNIEPTIWTPGKPGKPNYAAEQAMNPANAQRMVNALGEAETHAPNLVKGMDAWYVMDPMYQQMVRLVGPERAKIEYMKFNAIVPPFSAGSDVMTEINRGTTANMFATRGEYDTFRRLGGTAEKNRGADFPPEMRDTKGHAYHAVQADPVARWLATGAHGYGDDTVKIPLYAQASGVPEVGFQTRLPVPDAHFTRAAGIPDVRRNKNFNDYMGGSEYRPFGSWFRESVAKPLGIEAVPAQARMWGTFAPQTGVETAIGAPKLELISQAIWERAQRLGIDPKKLRDDVLLGKEHAIGLLTAGGLGTAAASKMGGLADQSEYRQ